MREVFEYYLIEFLFKLLTKFENNGGDKTDLIDIPQPLDDVLKTFFVGNIIH